MTLKGGIFYGKNFFLLKNTFLSEEEKVKHVSPMPQRGEDRGGEKTFGPTSRDVRACSLSHFWTHSLLACPALCTSISINVFPFPDLVRYGSIEESVSQYPMASFLFSSFPLGQSGLESFQVTLSPLGPTPDTSTR